MKTKTLIYLFLCCICVYSLKAQSAFVTTGGDTDSSSGNLSYSVSQIFYEPVSNTTGAITPGVMQPFEFFTLSIDNNYTIESVNAYPNPVKHFVTVDLGDNFNNESYYEIYDVLGKKVKSGKLDGRKISISMESYDMGIYLFKIISNSNSKTIKLIKK